MVTDFIVNKKFSLVCLFWVVVSFGFLQAQDKKAISDIEKVYLHTDRSIYFMGEDLWYKAYNVRSYNNLLFDNSNILYVELISADSKIIARNKTNLEMGLGNGDFHLTDSLGVKPGVYQLRAYTNWNRNFGEDFVFKKEIQIIDVFESHSKANKSKFELVQNNANNIGTQNVIKVDFFPEGGSLLENVASVVGFKAVDGNGNPITVTADVFDSDSELVTSFESVHDGMGKFQIIPNTGKKYYAKIKTQSGTVQRTDLPDALKNGYALSFRNFKGRNIIVINTNPETLALNPNEQLTVVCKSRGVTYFETTQTLTESNLSFELPKDKLPEGICQITLYDSSSKPLSERLVYIEKEHDLDVQITTDKATYQPNEKTTITVTSKSKAGLGKSASFSLSVTDRNGVTEEKDDDSAISSYYLVESDIRGKVHNPSYYFDATNPKRLEHLDNLILTQGWRDFIWKTAPKINDSVSYIAEKGITISGRVKQLLGEKALVNNTMTLALMNKKYFNIFNATTDSEGGFKFENLMFSGKTGMFLNSRNVKGKFRGELLLNPIEQNPIGISIENKAINWDITTRMLVDNVYRKFAAFGVKPENILDEVKIVAKKKSLPPVFYGIADNSYVPDESVATFTDIFQLIEQNIPGVVATDDSVRFTRFEGAPLFIIDGFEAVDRGQVSFIQPEDVLKIEAVKGATATAYYGEKAANGIISIFTKANTGQHAKKEVFHSIKKDIDGFYTARVFYVPDSAKPNQELDNQTAVRNTIYWNPYVHPDKEGNSTLNYYNTKVETKVKVALEGITATGIPVVKNIFYTIKK
ncbi:TonB-dependent receptor plug domain-containing protein [Flavobacterium sp. GSA192]|uniref:TonB-dependent receptor plug domain-containing protein n=1 Tax=Flavobacterium sp. GSA192 TaxID=2576304 RepID=UPI00112AB35F|nr:TonB-dependent receptor plug domain-containing protein [Flavobacterium sp. GSA192]